VIRSPYAGALPKGSKRSKTFGAFAQAFSAASLGEPNDQSLERLQRLYGKSSSWVYIATKRIADALAQIPLQIIRADKKGKPGALVEGPAGGLRDLLKQPNPYESRFDFISNLAIAGRLTGNQFVEKARIDGFGRPHELYALNPSRFKIRPGKNGKKVESYIYDLSTLSVTFPADEIIHIHDPHPCNDFWGLSPLTAALQAVLTDKDAAEWNRNFMQKGAWPAGALSTDNDADEKTMKRLRRELRSMVGGGKEKVGQVILLTGGLRFDKIALSPKEMDWLDARRMAMAEILAIYGVPYAVAALSSGEQTTQKSAGFGQQVVNFYLFTIFPLMEQLLGALNRELTPLFPGNLEIVADYRSIPALKDDVLKELVRAQAFRTLTSSFWSPEMALAELYPHVTAPPWAKVAWTNQAMIPISGPENPFAKAAADAKSAKDNVPTDKNDPAEGDPATADAGGAPMQQGADPLIDVLGFDADTAGALRRLAARDETEELRRSDERVDEEEEQEMRKELGRQRAAERSRRRDAQKARQRRRSPSEH
jgi:HK97 family phage portal protein